MFLTALATFAFSFSPSYPLLVVCWASSRFVQSQIWTNLVVIVGETNPTNRGSAVAILSQSFLVGDALAKLVLGAVASTLSWRGVSAMGGFVLLSVTTFVSIYLSPVKISIPSITSTNNSLSRSLKVRLTCLAHMPAFWCVCFANGGTNFVREVFRDWCPLLLVDLSSVSTSQAAMLGTVPSISGAAAVLSIGFLSDKCTHRGGLLVIFMGLSIACLLCLAFSARSAQPLTFTLFLIAGSSLLSGPYSVLTTCSLDCCSPNNNDIIPLFQVNSSEGSTSQLTNYSRVPFNLFPLTSLVQGLQDGTGYFFAATSGVLVGESLEQTGWSDALFNITGFAVVALFACAAYWREEVKRTRRDGISDLEMTEVIEKREFL